MDQHQSEMNEFLEGSYDSPIWIDKEGSESSEYSEDSNNGPFFEGQHRNSRVENLLIRDNSSVFWDQEKSELAGREGCLVAEDRHKIEARNYLPKRDNFHFFQEQQSRQKSEYSQHDVSCSPFIDLKESPTDRSLINPGNSVSSSTTSEAISTRTSAFGEIGTLKIISWNINGLRTATEKKICCLISMIIEFQPDFILLQETNIYEIGGGKKEEVEKRLKSICKCYWTTYDGMLYDKGRGVVILHTNNSREWIVTDEFPNNHQHLHDTEGRIKHILAENTNLNMSIQITNIHCEPSYNQKPIFFRKLNNELISVKHKIILAGDFNSTLHHLDSNLKMKTTKKLQLFLETLIERLNLQDSYRTKYPRGEEYTYCPKKTESYGSRIDKILGHVDFEIVQACHLHEMFNFSDHKPVFVEYKLKALTHNHGASNSARREEEIADVPLPFSSEGSHLRKRRGVDESNGDRVFEPEEKKNKTIDIRKMLCSYL